jgi:alpha-methylacyl-CoA racemase
MYGMFSQGTWADERGVNVLDTGAPWYNVYQTKDGKWLAVGAIEKRFYAQLIERLGLGDQGLPKQHDRKGWPQLREAFTKAIGARTRAEWERTFEGSDACVGPVLALSEVEGHPHNKARGTFTTHDGVLQPAPAPRFSRTTAELGAPPNPRGADTEEVLSDWGFSPAEIDMLKKAGVIGSQPQCSDAPDQGDPASIAKPR